MTWSYSRVTSYEDCPYKWFLSYIKRLDKEKLFFAGYGSFMHLIIQKYLSGELPKQSLVDYYLSNFCSEVKGQAPNAKIFNNYLQQGAEYLKGISFPYVEVIDIESKVEFKIDGVHFVGFIDIVASDEGIIIVDNKSRILKPRSRRKKPTQGDILLDQYLRQLYLYSIPISRQYGTYPHRLDFNCFRSNQFIQETFCPKAYEYTKTWALGRIKEITSTTNWRPKLDYFKCSYLCDVSHHCEYFTLYRGGG